MRALSALAALALLAGCATVNSTTSQAITAADALYTSASMAGYDLVALGKMDQAKYRDLDNRAYAVLLQVRAGKATVDQLNAIAAQLKGTQP